MNCIERIGPYKKNTFYEEKRWILKTCTRNRAGPLDDAPMVYGVRQNVECLMGTSNATQSAFETPIHDAMNGEIKLTTGVLGLHTQDGVDMVMNSPIINDGSNGKLVQLFISIKEPSEQKPMLHTMSSTTDPSKFMAAHNITLNGVRTSRQSTALQKKIYRTGIVKTIQKKGNAGAGRAMVRFKNKPDKLTQAGKKAMSV